MKQLGPHSSMMWNKILCGFSPDPPSCQVCYDRRWIPVSVETFIMCYHLRIVEGMQVDINQKVRECSEYVGHCTCKS